MYAERGAERTRKMAIDSSGGGSEVAGSDGRGAKSGLRSVNRRASQLPRVSLPLAHPLRYEGESQRRPCQKHGQADRGRPSPRMLVGQKL